MTFISTVDEDSAEGAAADLFASSRAELGFVTNFSRVFSHRPGTLAAFEALLDSIKQHMDPRRYELATIAAAKAMRNSYCLLAHGSVLLREHYSADELRAIVETPQESVLDEADRAIMRFAEKVVRDAPSVTVEDIDGLRAHGLSDPEIFDIATAAAARCFISKTCDSLGVLPDPVFRKMEPALQNALVVGRPIAD